MSLGPKLTLFVALALLAASCARIRAADRDVVPAGAGDGGAPSPTEGGDAGETRGGSAGASGGAAGAPEAGGAGVSSGGEGGEGGDAATACSDATAEVCLRPPFPRGVVPYAGDPRSPPWLGSAIRRAIEPWEGLRVGSTSLRFTEDRDENERALVIELRPGCGPASLTSERLTVAIGGCPDDRALTRAIGAALGLPRLHQRADRDRYLLMGARENFRCEQGDFFEPCPNLGDIPAQLGPFGFTTLMFAPGATAACTSDTYRYIVNEQSYSLQTACLQVSQSYDLSPLERSALAELYAIDAGWRPFLPIGADDGADARIRTALGDGAEPNGHALVRLDDGELGVFTYATGPGSRELWFTRRSELRWYAFDGLSDAWVKLANAPSPPIGGVARASESDVVDLFFADGSVAGVVLSADADPRVTWSTIELPTSGFQLQAAHPTPQRTALLYGTGGIGDPALYVRDTGLSADWTRVADLPSSSIVTTVARDGVQHVVSLTPDNRFYASADAQGLWSAWSTLPMPADLPANPGSDLFTGALVEIPGGLALIWTTQFGELWYWACDVAPCSNAGAWAPPVILAEGSQFSFVSALSRAPGSIDAVMGFTKQRAFDPLAPGLWHKRWEAP